MLVAPARRVSREEMLPAVEQLRSWGLKVEPGTHLHGESNQFSGTDNERLQDLQWALDHPSARAVILARGGYGIMRYIDRLDFTGLLRHPKWVIGYSDATILHLALCSQGIKSVHGPMPINFAQDPQGAESLRTLLMDGSVRYDIPPSAHNRPGTATAPMAGGNLSLLFANTGSRYDHSLNGHILFLEDLDEYLYHIDRMMVHLKRAGKLEKLAGLVVGGLSSMKDNPVPFGKTAEEIVAEAVAGYNYPVCFNFPAGHITPNMPFVHGATVRLDVNKNGGELNYE